MNFRSTPLFALGIGLSSVFTSCVDPYHTPPRRTAPVHPSGYVRVLPPGYHTQYIRGTAYYTHNGVYYRPRSGGYVIVEPPRRNPGPAPRRRDMIVHSLPPGYRTTSYHGVRYYHVDGTYYQRRGPGYVIVQRPY